jgi:hypothetical protein
MVTYLEDIDSLSVHNGTAFTIDRTIQVFAGTAARGSAIGTAVEGMYTHIKDTDSLEYYNGSAWESVGGDTSGLTHIRTTSISSLASQTFDDVFSSEFDNYFAICDFTRSTTSNITFRMRNAGTDDDGSNYIQQGLRAVGAGITSSSSTGTTGFLNNASGSTRIYASVDIYNPFLATRTNFYSKTNVADPLIGVIATEHQLTNSYDGLTIIASAGTMTGTIRIYGYKN